MPLSDVVEMPLEQKYFQEEKKVHKSTLFESKLKKEKKKIITLCCNIYCGLNDSPSPHC